jgi:hypothetical protein
VSEFRWVRPLYPGSWPWVPAAVGATVDRIYPASELIDIVDGPPSDFEIGPPIILPPALRAPDRDHVHKSERDDEHRFDSTGTVLRREYCSCGAIRQARLSQDEQLKLGDHARRGSADFGPWVRP